MILGCGTGGLRQVGRTYGFDFSLNILSLQYLSKLKVEMSIRLIEKVKYGSGRLGS